MEEPIPLKDAAQQFGVKLDRLRGAAWDGRLEARQVGNQWLVAPSEVTRFLRDGGRQRMPQQAAERRVGDALPRIVAVAVPTGGTGKTTTTLNLGMALAEQGKRVLLVDFDPQGNLTQALGPRPAELEHTAYSAIKYFLTRFESQLDLAICSSGAGLDLVPTSARLNLANDELAVAIQREFVLQKLLAPIAPRYDPEVQHQFVRIKKIWADSSYRGELVEYVQLWCRFVLEIVKRPAQQRGFQVQKKRWIVERILSWLNPFRRLSKDYENTTTSSESMVKIAHIGVLLRWILLALYLL